MLKLPEYVTVEEVKKVCRDLGIRDWTGLTDARVTEEEARIVLDEVNPDGIDIDIESFRIGLEVELEHGLRFKSYNVTNNHPVLTGKIVMAHFMETLDYYQRLEVAELEGDLLKATVAGNAAKVEGLYKKLVHARMDLSKAETRQLSR